MREFFHASTSEVYGDPSVHPQPESYRGNVNPIGLRACYDEGKRAAETLMFDYHRGHGIDTRVARIFNTYGPPHASLRWASGKQLYTAGISGRRHYHFWLMANNHARFVTSMI